MDKGNIFSEEILDVDIVTSINDDPKMSFQNEDKYFKKCIPEKTPLKNAYLKTMKDYENLYRESIENPIKFWKQMASEFYFASTEEENNKDPEFIYNFNPANGPVYTNFWKGMKTNICYNVLDRHLENFGDKTAFFWEGNDPADHGSVTYSELCRRVCVFANGLKSLGVQKGDIVVIYMPVIIETVVAMLACVRIGAVHSLIFVGYSAEFLAHRLVDGKVKVLITADGFWRGDKLISPKEICDEAIIKVEDQGHSVHHCIILPHLDTQNVAHHSKNMINPVYKWWDEVCEGMSENCIPQWVDAEDPLLILYTSGSTGNPKGIVHTTGGFLVNISAWFKYSYDFHAEQGHVMWSTVDLGWGAGHTNIVYGPLSLGGTSVLFEGSPFHPCLTRPWDIIQKYGVTHFQTVPSLLRHLMKFCGGQIPKFENESLRLLATLGEPISPKVWLWFHQVFGQSRCPIVDTYGQTETTGILTTFPGIMPNKPGSVGVPFFGVVPVLLDENGKIVEGEGHGNLAFSQPFPSIARGVHGDAKRFTKGYFSKFPGYFVTGDAARRDADGDFWILGRMDDMIKVSGRLTSATRVEFAILEHSAIAEAAVVPIPHEIKGQCMHAFVVLKKDYQHLSVDLVCSEVRRNVRQKLGSFSTPDVVWVSPGLPVTRTGKILRRLLITVAEGKTDFGDISALADVTSLQTLIKWCGNQKQMNDNRKPSDYTAKISLHNMHPIQ